MVENVFLRAVCVRVCVSARVLSLSLSHTLSLPPSFRGTVKRRLLRTESCLRAFGGKGFRSVREK